MRLLFILLFLFYYQLSTAQKILEQWSVAPTLRWGNMLKHTEKIKGPVAQNTYGLHIDFVYQTSGKKHWHRALNFPEVGFGLAYLNMNNAVYGAALGIYPFVRVPIIKHKRFAWDIQLGMGGAFINKHYDRLDPVTNQNVAISTHFNNYSPLSTQLEWGVTDKINIVGGASFVHLSNGGFKLPNLGINVYGAYAGIRYFPQGRPTNKYEPEGVPKVFKQNFGVMARAAVSYKESGPIGGPRLPSYLIDASMYKKYRAYRRVNIGVAYQYHHYKYFFYKGNYSSHQTAKKEAHQLAVYLNHEFIIGNLGIITQLGYYVHNPVSATMPLYQKIGGQYYLYQNDRTFLKSAYVNLILKTHTSNAELFEMGVGIGF